jgi:hypothetical protein
MNAPLSYSRLLHHLDELKLVTQPLPNHYVAARDLSTREKYARLIAVVLLCEPVLTEGQERVFRLLLGSLGLAESTERILEEAAKADRAFLLDCTSLFAEQGLSPCFIADIAVVLRLAGALSEVQRLLICEMADMLQMKKEEMELSARVAARVLGMPHNDELAGVDISKFAVWKEFLSVELTPERLVSGVKGGVWRVSSEIEVESSWSASNSTFFFEGDGCIKTIARDGQSPVINVEHCEFDAPVMTFVRLKQVRIRESQFHGIYSENRRSTALTLVGCSLAKVEKCDFHTREARALCVELTPLTVEHCNFKACGNEYLMGGGISIKRITDRDNPVTGEPVSLHIFESTFINCRAQLGGAIRIDALSDTNGASIFGTRRTDATRDPIVRCLFEACTSSGLPEDLVRTAVFANYTGNHAITNSTFRMCHLQMGDYSRGWTGSPILQESIFENGHTYFTVGSGYMTVEKDCTRKSSQLMPIGLKPEDWWNAF